MAVQASTRFKVSKFGQEGGGQNQVSTLQERRIKRQSTGKTTQPLYDHVRVGDNAGPQILGAGASQALGYYQGLPIAPFRYFPGAALPFGYTRLAVPGVPFGVFQGPGGRFFREAIEERAKLGLPVPYGVPPELAIDLQAGGGSRPLDVADAFGDHPQPNNNNPYDIDLALPYQKYSIPAGAGIGSKGYVAPQPPRHWESHLAHLVGGYMAQEIIDDQDTLSSPITSAVGRIERIVLPSKIPRGTSFPLKVIFQNKGRTSGGFRLKLRLKELEYERATEALQLGPGKRGAIVINSDMPAFIDPRTDIHNVDNDMESLLETGPDLHAHVDLLVAQGHTDVVHDKEDFVIHASNTNPEFADIQPDFTGGTTPGADNDNPDNATYEDIWETVPTTQGVPGMRRHRVLSQFQCDNGMRWSPCLCRCVPESQLEPKCIHPECMSSNTHSEFGPADVTAASTQSQFDSILRRAGVNRNNRQQLTGNKNIDKLINNIDNTNNKRNKNNRGQEPLNLITSGDFSFGGNQNRNHNIRPFVRHSPPVPFPSKAPASIIVTPNIVGPRATRSGDLVTILGKRFRNTEVVDIELHSLNRPNAVMLRAFKDTDSNGRFKKTVSADVIYSNLRNDGAGVGIIIAIGRDSGRVAKTDIRISNSLF